MTFELLMAAVLPLVPYPQKVTELGGRVAGAGIEYRADASLGVEAYRLRVADGRIVVSSSSDAGRFYAGKTLAQLRLADGSYPAVEIEDAPAFPWRGVLIDESRHFWGAAVVKRVLDRMAEFKLNVLHWHLTDSHGWRLQIDRYPELTARGATRAIPDWDFNIRDAEGEVGEYGPYFYTKDEVREILAYAKARHIRVVPEIELPGHSRELILCHPSFSCLDWGRFADMARTRHEVDQAAALCVGNDEVLKYLENILDEVVGLFPDEYVHIGGDECPRGNWKRCAKCQARMKAENLKSEDELQSWVTRRFSRYLAAKGRKIVGWDEILAGGLPDGAVVMSWRGAEGGIEAAKQGHDAIICPHQLCYLDYPTGEYGDRSPYPRFCERAFLNLEKVYSFDPYAGIPESQWKHVLGSQTLNWGESTWDEKDLEFKMWPRTCANAEIVWTGPGKRAFADFRERLRPVAAAMKAAGVNAAVQSLEPRGVYEDLLPRPRTVRYTAGRADAAVLDRVKTVKGKVDGIRGGSPDEAYRLEITAEGATITAPSEAGLRYGRVTLDQLKKLSAGRPLLTAVITDWPEYRWRGYMADTVRNFLPVPMIKRLLDVMAAYKLNLFHWHLTEHYGWRLESKRYPELHGPKAFLNRHPGLYFTQEEFREIVDYAWERGITVMPELDVPGHATAFRHAFGFSRMDDPRVTEIVENLFRELCALVPPEKMPFVHMGTDEVFNKEVEGVSKETITRWAKAITDSGRRVVTWDPGQDFDSTNRVSMLWGGSKPTGDGHPSFEARGMYIEDHDPFEALPHGAFDTMFNELTPAADRLGAIFCNWHDAYVGDGNYANVFRNVQVVPYCLLYGDNFWCGRPAPQEKYRSRLPPRTSPLFARAVDLERRVIVHRDTVLKDSPLPFQFVKQTGMSWRLTDETGAVIADDIPQATISPVKATGSACNFFDRTNGTAYAETWIRSPKAQEIGVWIGFLALNRDHGLEYIAPTPLRGEWNSCGAWCEVNGERIPGPQWNRPGLVKGKRLDWTPAAHWYELSEEPYLDQEYFMREPVKISLREGWNHVKLAAPCPGAKIGWGTRRWAMTFCPVAGTSEHPREVEGLEYSSVPR